MQLLNSLFRVVDRRHEGEQTVFDVELCAEHLIYRAHFPGHPITPGVCVMQMVCELAAEIVGHPVHMTGAKNVKFLAPIIPTATPRVTVRVTVEPTRIVAAVEGGEQVMAKLSLCHEA